MRRFTKRIWRFSGTLALYKHAQKAYLAYDSATQHICLHFGRNIGKLTLELSSFPTKHEVTKPQRKEIHV